MTSINSVINVLPPMPFVETGPFSSDIKKQIRLLNQSINTREHLSSILKAVGMSYDDLVYMDNNRPTLRDSRYYTIEDFAQDHHGVPVVSFFSGAGGLDLGLEAAGFLHSLLIEKNPLFCETIKSNKPRWNVHCGDVSRTNDMIETVSANIPSVAPFDGLFVGGPPCQPFSVAANQRFNKSGEKFKRVGFAHETNGNLLFEYIDLIIHFRPIAFLIENVPGLIDLDNGEQLQTAYRQLKNCGYHVHQPIIIRADAYSVPQQRTRLFIIGNRLNKEFFPPQATQESLSVGPVFKLSMKGTKNHVTREHSAESILRYMKLDYGNRDKLGRVDRLDPLLPSKTVIAGGTGGGGRSHLHPYIPRTLSVRECARIQTFPDSYVFTGPVARQFTQVGNAVPPVLGAQLGAAIFESFF